MFVSKKLYKSIPWLYYYHGTVILSLKDVHDNRQLIHKGRKP